MLFECSTGCMQMIVEPSLLGFVTHRKFGPVPIVRSTRPHTYHVTYSFADAHTFVELHSHLGGNADVVVHGFAIANI